MRAEIEAAAGTSRAFPEASLNKKAAGDAPRL
jgi:hypothetical protein